MWLLRNFTSYRVEFTLISRIKQPEGDLTVTLLTAHCGDVHFLLERYETNENMSNAQSEMSSMIQGPKTEPLDF